MCHAPVLAGVQVAPPSRLNSVKISKKLSMWCGGASLILVWPSDASVGLSRIITPAGRFPPVMFICSISVSNVRVLPVWLLKVVLIVMVAGASTDIGAPAPMVTTPRNKPLTFLVVVAAGTEAGGGSHASQWKSIGLSTELLVGGVGYVACKAPV
jgi:hypothetical protein